MTVQNISVYHLWKVQKQNLGIIDGCSSITITLSRGIIPFQIKKT